MVTYDVAGTGPALVLLHSTVCDRRMWDPQWPVLADAGYRVVRCDFRGYGETPVPTLERPQELSAMLTAFLRDTVPAG
jgi:3-oxoadipate enol-lactonase